MAPTALARIATNQKYLRPPHIALIEMKVLELVGRKIRFLLVMVPPRHGKSELISKFVPAWYIGMFPTHRVILASYEAGFARSWGRRARDLLAAYGGLFGVTLREDVLAQDEWETTEGGGMMTAGVGGAITGKGANLIIVDDPHKNAEEALSETMREKVWEWFQSTLYTRLEPNGVIVVMQTRWHESDLTGKLLTESNLDFDVLRLPALAEPDDPLGRDEGAALWPVRYDQDTLLQIQDTVGSYWWNALYQQAPRPLGGLMFRPEWFGRYELDAPSNMLKLWKPGQAVPTLVPLASCLRFGTMDLAVSTKDTADWTVLISFAMTPDRELVILDVDRQRLESPDQPAMIRRAIVKNTLAFVGVEDTAYQLSLVQYARRQTLPVKGLRADKDKISRALTASALQESGNIYIPKWAPWLGTFEHELYGFPGSEHDDQVDAFAYGAIYASLGGEQGTFD